MAQFLTIIGRHLECAIQTKPVVELELALIEREQSRRFRGGDTMVANIIVPGSSCAHALD